MIDQKKVLSRLSTFPRGIGLSINLRSYCNFGDRIVFWLLLNLFVWYLSRSTMFKCHEFPEVFSLNKLQSTTYF